MKDPRVRRLNEKPIGKGDVVLYWMQQSQRATWNHALEFAVSLANDRKLPLLVGFGLTPDYPEANRRHFTFMLEGLKETREALQKRGIKMVVRLGRPDEVALGLGRRAAAMVCDRGYLRHQRTWRQTVAQRAGCAVFEVESDVVVPVEVASPKAEFAARTLRPRLHRQLDAFLTAPATVPHRRSSLDLRMESLDLARMSEILDATREDPSAPAVSDRFRGGPGEARRKFRDFLENRLARYVDNRRKPHAEDVSCMSMYLHFGQVSPLYLALGVRAAKGVPDECKEAFLEEVIVRRELAVNYVLYRKNYDAYKAVPEWARDSLRRHAGDPRRRTYTPRELAGARTHDRYWNAAMLEMKATGYLHNVMRMYWGKKILEWSACPARAFRTALELNNRYFLDGRDPNSFAGVAWVFGLHDRPWPERSVYGKVRTMTASGLERKSDIHAYVERVESLTGQAIR